MSSRSNVLADISVIICTHNRAKLLRDALNSLEKADTPEHIEIELVIVDNFDPVQMFVHFIDHIHHHAAHLYFSILLDHEIFRKNILRCGHQLVRRNQRTRNAKNANEQNN